VGFARALEEATPRFFGGTPKKTRETRVLHYVKRREPKTESFLLPSVFVACDALLDMDNPDQPGQRPRYRWPWFVLGGVVLFIVLAVLWMTVLVRRVHEERENAWPPASQTSPSNPPAR
jgi:hypothetical protein